MLRKIIFSISFCLLTISIFAQSNDAVLGKWLNASGEGKMEIFKKGERYFGKLIWLKEPNDASGHPKIDKKNPDSKLQNQTILGLEILKNFSYTDEKWENGTVYDPKSGKTYSCKLTMKDDNHLSMRGFIGVSLLGRTEIWTRTK